MSHRMGPAKPPIETKTALRGIIVGLAVVVLAIVVPLAFSQLSGCDKIGSGSVASSPVQSAEHPQGHCKPIVSGLPRSADLPLYFESGQTSVTIRMRADAWSREIVTPADSVDYRIDVSPPDGYLIFFKDGTLGEVSADQTEVKDHGVRRGIFRLSGNSANQVATVTISR